MRFGVTLNAAASVPGKLDFQDNVVSGAYNDLSEADSNWAAWRDQVRAYLDSPANARINVMMWSWCDITGHSVPDYLNSMQTLIGEYGAGGTKIGTGSGKTRTTPVTFIFMTGHAVANANTGAGNPREQARLITDYCAAHNYYCIDYYSIDTHAMNNDYYEDAGDNGDSLAYGGNFYQDWQASHALGFDWYKNLESPGGMVSYGDHNTQHITANRKAFAFWGVLARIAGYPTVSYSLAYTKTGTGGGTVTSLPQGISCRSSCSSAFVAGTPVTLLATPDSDSVFSGWSGSCTGTGNCQFIMNSNRAVTGTFSHVQPVRITGISTNYYSTLSAAYIAAWSGSVIQSRVYTFNENLNINRNVSTTLRGGYNISYSSNGEYTTLRGVLTIGRGSFTAENLVIR